LNFGYSVLTKTVSSFSDDVFSVYDNGDNTKLLNFECSGISTGTTRTYTWPDSDGTVALTSDLTDYVKRDGTTSLTGNWDAGSFEIRAEIFQSDVTTGTKPLTIASTTLCDNLNADLLDGQEGAYYLNIVNDTTPQLGGDLDGQSTYDLTNMVHGTFSGTVQAEQLTSTDDITMNGHLLTLGDGSANDITIRFDGSTYDSDLKFDENLGKFEIVTTGRYALSIDQDYTEDNLTPFEIISFDFDLEYNNTNGLQNVDCDIYGNKVLVTNYTDFDQTGYDLGYQMEQWGSYLYVIDRANYTGTDEEYGPRLKQIGTQSTVIATEGTITAEDYAFITQYGTYSFVQNAKYLNNANTTATSLQYGNYTTVSAMTLQDTAGTYNVTQYGNYMTVTPPQPGNISGTTRCYGDYINFSAAGASNVDYLYILYLKAGNPIPTPSNWYALYSDTTVKSLFKGAIWIDNDDREFIWGAAQDGGIWYDGTDLACNPQLQGTGRFKIMADDSVTTAVTNVAKLAHITDGTASIGFGVGLEWVLEDSGDNEDVAAIEECVWTGATSGNESADLIWKLKETGSAAAERLRLTSGGNLTLFDGGDVVIGTVTGTKFGTATNQKLSFYNATPIVQPTSLTAQLTTITHTAPGTPDYAIQDLTNSSPYGFATKDEGNSVLSVIANLQTRLDELETKLQNLGLVA
jgi:hypothetical protein